MQHLPLVALSLRSSERLQNNRLTLNDRDDLALFARLVRLHQNRFDRAAFLGRRADLHLHRLDEHDILAGTDLRAGLGWDSTDAARDLSDDLLFCHLRPRLWQSRSTAIRQEKGTRRGERHELAARTR